MNGPLPCPGCGAERVVDGFRRTAGEFCRVCDYPLFFARGSSMAQATPTSGSGLGDLAGRSWETIPCPSCEEANPTARDTCLRCDAVLRPEPEPEPAPVDPEPIAATEPVVAPPPVRSWWEWLRPDQLLRATAVLGVAQAVVLLAR